MAFYRHMRKVPKSHLLAYIFLKHSNVKSYSRTMPKRYAKWYVSEKATRTDSPRASNTFNQNAEAKRFEGVFLCRKYADFQNQNFKKIGWYTKMLCATEYPGSMQFLKLALKWVTLYTKESNLKYLASKGQLCIGVKLFCGTQWMR